MFRKRSRPARRRPRGRERRRTGSSREQRIAGRAEGGAPKAREPDFLLSRALAVHVVLGPSGSAVKGVAVPDRTGRQLYAEDLRSCGPAESNLQTTTATFRWPRRCPQVRWVLVVIQLCSGDT